MKRHTPSPTASPTKRASRGGRTIAVRPILGALLVAILLGACGDDRQPIAETQSARVDAPASGEEATTTTTQPDTDDGTPVATSSSDDATDSQCAPGPDRTVTELEDVVIPAVETPPVVVDDTTLAGETVPGFEIPGVEIPEQVVDAGCIIEYDAPGGCLGAVEITGFEIPAVELPAVDVPGSEAAGRQIDGIHVEAAQTDAVQVEGVRTEQVCQQQPTEGGGIVASVTRPAIVRASAVRPSIVRASAVRASQCASDPDAVDQCIESVSVPSVSVPSVSVPSTSVQSESLEARIVGDSGAEVIEDDDQTAYLAPADVLFDFDQAVLRPDAVPTLQAIVTEIRAQFTDFTVTVEGHTDAIGTPEYNQQLSEDRAAAVAQWLSTEGGIPADVISTAGYGETAPVAPNTNPDGSDNPAGRAANRRVAITVEPR